MLRRVWIPGTLAIVALSLIVSDARACHGRRNRGCYTYSGGCYGGGYGGGCYGGGYGGGCYGGGYGGYGGGYGSYYGGGYGGGYAAPAAYYGGGYAAPAAQYGNQMMYGGAQASPQATPQTPTKAMPVAPSKSGGGMSAPPAPPAPPAPSKT